MKRRKQKTPGNKRRRQKSPAARRRQASRRQRVLHAVGRAAFLLILVAAAITALTVFFKVSAIEVTGATRYTEAEIVSGMDVKVGDNLYLWNKVKTSDALLAKFPYLESVLIRRKLPDKLTVTVTECKPTLAVPSDGGYYLVSDKGKVLEQRADDGGLPVATGVSLMGMEPGKVIDRTTDAYADALMCVLDALREGDMVGGLKFINLQSLTDIRIGYLGRFDIRVGTVDELSYRLRFASIVISDRLSPSDIGRLYWDARDRLHFVPDAAENVAHSAVSLDGVDQTALQNGQKTENGADGAGPDETLNGMEDGGGETDGADETGDAEDDQGDQEDENWEDDGA